MGNRPVCSVFTIFCVLLCTKESGKLAEERKCVMPGALLPDQRKPFSYIIDGVTTYARLSFYIHWISLSTWDLGPEEIRAISDFAL